MAAKQTNDVIISLVSDFETLRKCREIRRQIFQIGQNVAKEIEEDEHDAKPQTENCVHFAAFNQENQVIGTCRIRFLPPYWSKLERVAVKPEFRGLKVGQNLNRAAIDFQKKNWPKTILKTHAQLPVVEFYEKLNFRKMGEIFYEAEIGHYLMFHFDESVKIEDLAISGGTFDESELQKIRTLFCQ